MRKFGLLLLLVGSFAFAGAISFDTSVRKEFTDCSSNGSSAQTLSSGSVYVFRVTDEDTFVCFAASASTCASGGEKFPMGTVMLVTITGDTKSVSCRSPGSTGDAIFTRAQ